MFSTALSVLSTGPVLKEPLLEEGGSSWRVVGPLGRGASATVFRVGRGTARAALKRVSCGDGDQGRALYGFVRERNVLENVRGHANIVQLYGVFMNPGPLSGLPGPTSQPCLLLELLDISVSELLLRWEHLAHGHEATERGSSLWMLQHCTRDVLHALAFLHARGYVHADLKPQNILWSAKDECFKLIDFGLSFKHGEQDVKYIQTEGYRAPEAEIQNQAASLMGDVFSSGSKCGCPVDLWSLGIILLEMYWAIRLKDLGPSPEWAPHSLMVVDRILSFREDLFSTILVCHLRDLIKGMLVFDRCQRSTAMAALQNPFFNIPFAPNVEDLLFLPTRVLRLLNLVVDAHMLPDDEYQDVLEDVKEECNKFGEVQSVLLPKEESNKGQVFVEFSDPVECQAAQQGLSGRSFDGKLVVATFFPSDAYRHGYLYQPLS
uniref:serine/threonine-protein kinase Kist-like n=1 Tax=Myxine glutinosa TaxID=7769 RepID=UPI00358F8288